MKKLRRFISFFIISIFACQIHAQEVLLRQNSSYTELTLTVPESEVENISQKDNAIIVLFRKPLKNNFSTPLNDKFIIGVEGSGRTLKVSFSIGTDFAVFNDDDGLKFIGAGTKAVSDVLLSYGLSAPLLRKTDTYADDPVAEAILKEADNLTMHQDYYGAIIKLDNLAENSKSSYYQQEALFRMSDVYMLMGQTDTDAYNSAAMTMDKLIKLYPDSSRLYQAQKRSATAKELAGQIHDAVQTYYEIFDMKTLDTQTRREALERIGELYQNIGQYDRALDAYRLYLANFKTDSEKIESIIGKLYLLQGKKEESYGFFGNLPIADITSTLDRQQMITLANIFSDKGEAKRAYELYDYIVKNRDPNLENDYFDREITSEAMYNMAGYYKSFGDMDNYNKALSSLASFDPESSFGQLAIVEFAENNYKSRNSDEWRDFLQPVYDMEDTQNLWQRADLVLIKAMYNDGNYRDMVNSAEAFITDYPSSDETENLLAMKQDAMYTMAQDAEKNGDNELALQYYKSLITDYPDSQKAADAEKQVDDVYFNRAITEFNDGNYKTSKQLVENRFIDMKNPSQRWFDLWDEAAYNTIIGDIGVADPKILRYECREYLAESEVRKYAKDVQDILLESFKYPFFQAAANGESAKVLDMFNENTPWLITYKDQELYNRVKIAAAAAFINMGLKTQAEELFVQITPMMNNEYAFLGYSLCKNFIYDINNFTDEEFYSVINLAENCGTDYALNIAKKYTKNIKASAKAQYDISKSISDDKQREKLVNYLYNLVSSNPASRFDGYEDLYLDTGLAAFRKRDYEKAAPALQQYTELVTQGTEKKAEALYYLGKIFANLNQMDESMKYYEQLVNTTPDSVYKNMAKSELEDYNWRKSLNR